MQRPGDATNIWGWAGIAVASLGAGGLGFKPGRKKKRRRRVIQNEMTEKFF